MAITFTIPSVCQKSLKMSVINIYHKRWRQLQPLSSTTAVERNHRFLVETHHYYNIYFPFLVLTTRPYMILLLWLWHVSKDIRLCMCPSSVVLHPPNPAHIICIIASTRSGRAYGFQSQVFYSSSH